MFHAVSAERESVMGQTTQLREECRFSVLHFESRDSDVLRDRAEDAFGVDRFVPDVATLPLDFQSFGSFPTV